LQLTAACFAAQGGTLPQKEVHCVLPRSVWIVLPDKSCGPAALKHMNSCYGCTSRFVARADGGCAPQERGDVPSVLIGRRNTAGAPCRRRLPACMVQGLARTLPSASSGAAIYQAQQEDQLATSCSVCLQEHVENNALGVWRRTFAPLGKGRSEQSSDKALLASASPAS
jgi:hypothetical protein